MRRGVSKADLAEIRKRTPKPAIPFLVIRSIVDPRPGGLPPVIGPRTAMHEAMIAAACGTPVITGGLSTTLEYRTRTRDESVERLVRALEAAGITFLSETSDGVGLRGQIKR